MKKRLLCLWFPDWPIQRLRISQPQVRQGLLFLTETSQGRDLVRFCCPQSQEAGIRAGMTLSDAQSQLRSPPKVFILPVDREQDRQALHRLAIWCERYSPCAGLEEAEHPQCLLLDVTGVFPLFSGEQPLAELIPRELGERRLSVRVAIADTIGSAWAAARFLTNAGPAIIPAGQQDAILALPVEALRLSPSLIEKLHKLGLKTIQQVQRLDHSALKARFGSDILLRMQQLTGECRELITPCRPAPVWEVRRDLETGTSDFQVVEQLCLAVLQDLIRMLQTRHLGASELCCRLLTEDRGRHEFSLRLREATADVRHLGELLRLKLEQVTLGSALVGIHLKAEASAPLKWHELQLFAEESRHQARQLTVLLDRLSNRLGPEAVVHALPRPDPIPERALEFVPVSQTPPASMAAAGQPLLPLDRPLCLLPEPEPIQVLAVVPDGPPSVLFWEGSRKVIAKCFGPERIESGWWRGASVRRDYYRVETQEGQRFWLFRRISDQTWFLHGKAF